MFPITNNHNVKGTLNVLGIDLSNHIFQLHGIPEAKSK